ncbi:MAG: hypothetical protein V3U78_05460 [Thiotrichaceae bacterium]
MKKCSKCKIPKDLSQFYKKKDTKDGHAVKCKSCAAEYGKMYRKENRETLLLKKKQYYSQPHVKVAKRENEKEWRKTNSGKLSDTKANKKTHAKYPNAQKSRSYYNRNKQKLTPLEHCEHCNIKPDVMHAHHRDYDKPLHVIYLCPQCHSDEHKINTPLNRVTGIFMEKKNETL